MIYINYCSFDSCCFNVVFSRWRSGYGSVGSVFWNVPHPEKEDKEIWDR